MLVFEERGKPEYPEKNFSEQRRGRTTHKWLRRRTNLNGLCIKVGRGQGDRDIGTRVWGLGTWGRETRDLRTSSMGRGDVWDGDAGTSNTWTQGTRDVNDYCKSRR